MALSIENANTVYEAIKAAGIRLIAALPDTWLVSPLNLASNDPEMTLVEVAKEEEAVGVAIGCHFAGVPSAVLIQNHGLLSSVNPIVSVSLLYHIPLFMIATYRGYIGEHYPWHTRGGIVTEPLLQAMGVPYEVVRRPEELHRAVRDSLHYSQISLGPTMVLLTPELMAPSTAAGG